VVSVQARASGALNPGPVTVAESAWQFGFEMGRRKRNSTDCPETADQDHTTG
jgi:hypothetical protein